MSIEDRYIEPPPIDLLVYERKIRTKLRTPVSSDKHPELLKYAVDERKITIETLDAWRVSSMGSTIFRWPIYAWGDDGWQIANARMRDRENGDWFEIAGGCTDLLIGNHLLGVVPGYTGSLEGADTYPETTLAIGDHVPKRVIITEGQWDCMTGYQLGIPNMTSLPNGANHASMLRYIPEDWEVWLAVDMDGAGDRATEKIFEQLGSDRVARIHMPHKDLNDWLRAEPDLTAEMVYAKAKGVTAMVTVQVEKAHELTRFMSFLDENGDEETDDPLICDLPWELATELIGGGLFAKQTTGILAPSGIGKTTLVDQIAIHCAAKAHEAVGVITIEGSRVKAKKRYRQQAEGYTKFPADALAEVASRLNISELQGKLVPWTACIEEFEVMAKSGCKLLIWDNIDHQLPSNSGNFQKLDAYAAFQDLCMRTGCHGIMVWQPFKIDREKVVNSGDQKGMAQALQDSDNYMNLNQFGNLRRIEIEKTRELGVNQDRRHVWLKYDPETRCLHETENQANIKLVPNHQAEWGGM